MQLRFSLICFRTHILVSSENDDLFVVLQTDSDEAISKFGMPLCSGFGKLLPALFLSLSLSATRAQTTHTHAQVQRLSLSFLKTPLLLVTHTPSHSLTWSLPPSPFSLPLPTFLSTSWPAELCTLCLSFMLMIRPPVVKPSPAETRNREVGKEPVFLLEPANKRTNVEVYQRRG